MNFDSRTKSKFINNLLILISIITKVKDNKLLHYNVIKCYHVEKLGTYYTGFLVLVLKIVHEFIILKIKKSLIEKALIPLS